MSSYSVAKDNSSYVYPDKDTYLLEISKLLKVQRPHNRTVNIVCHGHSVPAGIFKAPIIDTFNAYPHLLHKELKERFPYSSINVIVTSIGGENSVSGAKRFESDVLNHKPDIVTIDYALNDRYVGLKKARASWSKMIELAKKNNVQVILLTPTIDMRSNISDPNDPLNQHANQIRSLAETFDVALVDSLAKFRLFQTNGGDFEQIMSSVNHPNRQGHDMVVELLMEWFPH